MSHCREHMFTIANRLLNSVLQKVISHCAWKANLRVFLVSLDKNQKEFPNSVFWTKFSNNIFQFKSQLSDLYSQHRIIQYAFISYRKLKYLGLSKFVLLQYPIVYIFNTKFELNEKKCVKCKCFLATHGIECCTKMFQIPYTRNFYDETSRKNDIITSIVYRSTCFVIMAHE